MKKRFTITLFLAAFCFSHLLKAQVFPVQINTQVLPPYSPYLTDYTTPGAQKFVVQLRVNDPTISEYRCKLRITIEGVGITIRTRPSFIPQPLVLEGGGIPQIFYGEDLSDYFNPNNLDFAGISRSEYSRNAKLPEGVYRFSVEVLDYNRNTVVSTKTTTIAWIILNDPPILNLPHKDFKVQITDPLNLPFNWTPRHKGSPNAAFTTEYIFRLVEVWPINRNPYDAFLSQQPLYETRTSDQQVLYGPAEPSLIPGRKYAWQVQAVDVEGRDLFKNQGRSEVYVFQFGDEIGVPENVRKEAANASNITVRWEPATTGEMPEKYRIRYKPAATTTWYETTNEQSWATLAELKSNTAYDVQVRGEKGKRFGAFTPPQRFSTVAANPDNGFACGQPANITQPSETNLLFALAPGDIFSCNDFRIVVTEVVSGSNGVYSGKGLAQVKMLNGASIEVTFAGSINNEYQLVTGNVRSIYDRGSKIGVFIDNMYKIGEGDQEPAKRPSDSTFASPPITYFVPGRIDSIYVDGGGTIVVINDKGEQTTYHQPVLDSASNKKQDVILTDTQGNSYTVSAGKVINNGTTAANAVASAVSYSVTFDGVSNQQFGFDKQQHSQLEKYYDYQTIKGEKYFIPWKAVAIGSFDNVKASPSVKRADFSREIGFRSTVGALPKIPGSDSEAILTVQGSVHQQVEAIEAYLTKKDSAGNSNEEVIGRLNVISYNKIYRTLVLVPVNGTNLPNNITSSQIQQELSKIYGQAAVQWQVQITSDPFSSNYDDNEDGRLEFGNSGIFSNYTREMHTIINGYKNNNVFSDDTYYLFLVPSASDKTAKGFMPRKKQAGFIFTEQLGSANPIKTIAHELAHGAFRLKHSFPELPENGNNLLDYSATGTYLHKYQWDLVHDPVAVLGVFEGDEAGASFDCPMWFSGDCETVGKLLDLIKNSHNEGRMIRANGRSSAYSELAAKSIELDEEKFDNIKLINLVEDKKSVNFNPKDFEEYNEQFLTREGKIDYQRGFIYRTSPRKKDDPFASPEPIIFKILVYHAEAEISEKLKVLKKYLYTEQNEQTKITNAVGKRYVVYKNDANIRNNVSPYNLVTPEDFLEKGREVELISHLIEGDNPRSLVKYKGETEEYCTWTGNLMEIVSIDDNQQYKLTQELSPFVLPYSENTVDKVTTGVLLQVTHQCGIYKLISVKDGDQFSPIGWVKNEDLKRYVDNSKLGKDEFSKKFAQATSTAVEAIIQDWKTNEAACNLCVRAALMNLTGDEVLYPKIGSSTTIRDEGQQIHGKVEASEGSAQGIIDDLKNNKLTDYFEEIEKAISETYAQYWERLQNMVDNNKEIIIGTYDPGHVFMIVPGGQVEVVDNTQREKSGLHKSQTNVVLGDQWGGSFARRTFNNVLRIMDCGRGVKFSNGPMYGVMDAGGALGERDTIVKFYKYKAN